MTFFYECNVLDMKTEKSRNTISAELFVTSNTGVD